MHRRAAMCSQCARLRAAKCRAEWRAAIRASTDGRAAIRLCFDATAGERALRCKARQNSRQNQTKGDQGLEHTCMQGNQSVPSPVHSHRRASLARRACPEQPLMGEELSAAMHR